MTARNASKKLAGPPPLQGEDFTYTAPNGGTITLPPMAKALDAAELRRLRKATPLEMVYHILERDYSEEELVDIDKALASMSLAEDVPELVEKWQEFSKISAGESSAS